MPKHLKLSMIMAVTTLGLAVPLHAQGRSTISSAELDAAVAPRPAANHQAVREVAATDQVRKAAAPTEAGDRVLAGGSGTIVISTTAVIIGLLILILLVG